MVALDLDQAQPGTGVLGQQGTHQGGLAGAARAPEQGMVGWQAVDELAGVACQLLALGIDADQVGQGQVQAHRQRLQIAAATLAVPTRGEAVLPVNGRAGCRQQGFEASQHGIGTLEKCIQTGIHSQLLGSAAVTRHCWQTG
ncbi:hypothetical protein D9M71_547360 [compost metagenome]